MDIRNQAFTQDQINKIGNAIIYCSKIPELNRTKILHLLFLLEEACITKYGHPFFGLEFQLWKIGPIAKDIYIDLCDGPFLLKDYIQRRSPISINFIPKVEFNSDEFSDNDIAIMDVLIQFISDKNANDLLSISRGQNSLWRKSAGQYGVLEVLEQGLLNSTEYTVDFTLLFNDTPEGAYLKERLNDSKETMKFVRPLKR